MIGVLIGKDLRRARRNPLPWLVNLAIPLGLVGLFGLAFGGGGSAALGTIRVGVVDEDRSALVRLLRGALNQGQAAEHVQAVFLDRATALAQLNADTLSAVVVVPAGFSDDYLAGRRVTLELVKNPGQAVHPAVVEEFLGALVAGLNAVARSFAWAFPDLRALVLGEVDYRRAAAFIEVGGPRLEAAREYLDPPLVGYEEEVRPGAEKGNFNLFGYLLAGMAGMFLLFLAGTGMRDLLAEIQVGTLERYHTVRDDLWRFLAAKILFVGAMLVLCAFVLFGGGGLAFGITWRHPGVLAALCVAYSAFAAGLMAVVISIAADERQASAFSTLVSMTLALLGGCMFPPEQLPAALRAHVMPLVPTYWFCEAVRTVTLDAGGLPWPTALASLFALAAFLLAVAAFLLRSRFRRGNRR